MIPRNFNIGLNIGSPDASTLNQELPRNGQIDLLQFSNAPTVNEVNEPHKIYHDTTDNIQNVT